MLAWAVAIRLGQGTSGRGTGVDELRAALVTAVPQEETGWRDFERDELTAVWLPLAGDPGSPPSTVKQSEASFYLRDGSLHSAAAGECALPSTGALGHFAVVHWCWQRRRLRVWRDLSGVRPVFFGRDEQRLVVASDFAAVATLLGEAALDPIQVGVYLTGDLVSNHRTFVASVKRLPPGHRLSFEKAPIVEPFDAYRPPPLHAFDSSACGLEFRRRVVRSIRRSAGTGERAVFHLSGGLDSSTLCALALKEKLSVTMTSLVFPGRACDESPAIAAVATWLGNETKRFIYEPRSVIELRRAASRMDIPSYPNGAQATSLRKWARLRGARVEVAGGGGDEVCGRTFPTSRRAMANVVLRDGLRAAWGAGLREVFPSQLVSALSRFRHPLRPELPPWLRRDALRRDGTLDAMRAALPQALSSGGLAALEVARRVHHAWPVHARETEVRDARALGLLVAFPFLDREVVEWSQACHQFDDAATSAKPLLQSAMLGLLPPSVLRAPEKVDFADVMRDELLSSFGNNNLWAFDRDHLEPSLLRFVARDLGAEESRTLSGAWLWAAWNLVAMCHFVRISRKSLGTSPAGS